MTSIVDQLTEIYVVVDDYLKAHPKLGQWRRSPNAHPAFTDAEVITGGLAQGCFEVATLEQTYRLVAANYRTLFPRLCSYPQWVARLHALGPIIGLLVATLGSERRIAWPTSGRGW